MPDKKIFDVAIIGAGPGGYVAAIKAAQLGKTVALIEKNLLGGTCLNVGCIPTKTLISSASIFHIVKKAADFGIQTGPISVAYEKMKERKDAVVAKIRKGLEGLIQSNRVVIFQGNAQFESPKELKVVGKENVRIFAENIVIATGSVPVDIKAFPCDHQRILNSTSILELTQLPKSLIVVGGGYIGCEFASLFAELGTKITILEALPSVLAAQGDVVAKTMTAIFEKQGIDIRTNVMVKNIETSKNGVQAILSDGSSVEAEFALVAIGRKVYTENLCLEKAGLRLSEKGFLPVNEHMETDVRGIFAIGDVTGKSMLAHVASHQGLIAAMNIAGDEAKAHYEAVPAVIFTSPEIASVGLTEQQAVARGFSVSEVRFPFQAIGKAEASGKTEGFSQILSDKKTGQILGATIIGHEASNLIAEITLAIQNELTLESIYETIHAHPTMAEIWHETAALGLNMPIHLPPKKR